MLINGYRTGRLSLGFLASALRWPTTLAAQPWLADHNVPLNYDLEEFEANRRPLRTYVAGQLSDLQRVRAMIDAGLNELNEREQEVVCHHFGLVQDGAAQTLEQLGKRSGVTKERVRQIELRALARLREVLSPSLSDAIA